MTTVSFTAARHLDAGGKLPAMRYRVENISVPHTAGIARPGEQDDDSRPLTGRRIVHVLSAGEPDDAIGATILRVLTEQDD